MDAAEQFKRWVEESDRMVFLSGAGISTESGIPDFRSPGGLYSDPANLNIFDITAFLSDPAPFYRFAGKFLPIMEKARPNRAHTVIARLQDRLRVTVVTQNIDDLHQRAGSEIVWCVHGNLEFSRCLKCGHRIKTNKLYPIIQQGQVPLHDCGGVYKPEVTFFGEPLPPVDWTNSQRAIEEADLLCVVGSSLTVYPAASLPAYRNSDCRLVLVNRDPTPLDGEADLVLRGNAGDVFAELLG